jgi:hypothetical protein
MTLAEATTFSDPLFKERVMAAPVVLAGLLPAFRSALRPQPRNLGDVPDLGLEHVHDLYWFGVQPLPMEDGI